MKIHIFFILCLALGLTACSTADFRSRKKIDNRPIYGSYQDTETHYEFTSVLPEYPSVLGEGGLEEVRPVGSDEDFTSENLSNSYGNYGDVVVTVAAKKIRLGASATQKDMALFRQALDTAYAFALREYRPAGFTYSMSSVGAVNPLSDIEVGCMLGEQSASEVGQSTCNLFFRELSSNYDRLTSEAN